MRTPRIYSLNFPKCHTAVLAIVSVLHIVSLVLTYLITESLYLLTTFFQFPLLSPSNSGNHKSDFFFSELLFLGGRQVTYFKDKLQIKCPIHLNSLKPKVDYAY